MNFMSRLSRSKISLIAGLSVLLVLIGLYNIPWVYNRVYWRIDDLRNQIMFYIQPQSAGVFVPVGNKTATILPSPQVMRTAPPTPTVPLAASSTLTPAQSATPAMPSTPLPAQVSLPGVIYVDQHHRWNYCGPANLSMALNFWGWKGTRDDIAEVIKPGIPDPKLDFIQKGKTDKNVMPYELINFVNNNTPYHALQRFGGDMDLIKRLIAAGFPVVIEKGYYERDYNGRIGWMGHYLFVTGYDDARGGFIVQDAYLVPGKNLLSKYTDFEEGWRSFDYLFMVVYPTAKENQVVSLLGDWNDLNLANQKAMDKANEDIKTQKGIDLFFAWFNAGTSHVQLLQYQDAANAYDQAFSIYATLETNDQQRPYRIMWYQSWPYWAYYYSGRYQDVVDLATTALTYRANPNDSFPMLEESFYWRAMGELGLGQSGAAVNDLQQAVYYNSSFSAALQKLQEIGAPLKP